MVFSKNTFFHSFFLFSKTKKILFFGSFLELYFLDKGSVKVEKRPLEEKVTVSTNSITISTPLLILAKKSTFSPKNQLFSEKDYVRFWKTFSFQPHSMASLQRTRAEQLARKREKSFTLNN